MKERPIPFSAPMVRALLAGTKMQTRRLLKSEPPPGAERVIRPFRDERLQWAATDPHDMEQGQLVLGEAPRSPYGQPGDRLWVREAWRSGRLTDRFAPREMTPHPVWYEADGPAPDACNGKLRPGMFMPRWASRITLEITGVRVERLQDISVADAMAEGVVETNANLRGLEPCMEWRYAYEDLWNQINGPGAWAANPWVWVVEFRRA